MNPWEIITAPHAALAIRRNPATVDCASYLDHMTFRSNAHPLFTEIFGPLLGLKDEWAAQGASPAELDFSAFRFRDAREYWLPVSTGWLGGEEPVILSDTPDLLVYRDPMGRRMQLSRRAATLALPLTYPVATREDWRRIQARYAFSPARLPVDWPAPPDGAVIVLGVPGGFDEPRQLLGEEALATACYDEPELLHAILETIGDTVVEVIARLPPAVRIDQVHIHEDMAGRSGPLFGPRQVREFLAPYYRRVWDAARARGARLFKQDSDGDLRPVIPAFLEAGVNVMYPCEPAAGMDIVELRREYGTRLAFTGGIDKHVLRRGRDAIVAELEYKFPPMVRSGGCVLGLDHRVPNGTPLAAYRFYLDRAWEILERETR